MLKQIAQRKPTQYHEFPQRLALASTGAVVRRIGLPVPCNAPPFGGYHRSEGLTGPVHTASAAGDLEFHLVPMLEEVVGLPACAPNSAGGT